MIPRKLGQERFCMLNWKAIMGAVYVIASGLTNIIIAEEVVSCRNLQIIYDTTQLEEELKIVENCFMPRYHRGKGDTWTAIPLRNATGTDSQEGVEFNHTIQGKKMLPCKNTPFMERLPYISSIIEQIAIHITHSPEVDPS